jgi:TonB family protein
MDTDEQHRRINRYVAMSAALHIALFLVFAVGELISPKPMVALPTIQVDIVALPNQVKNAEPTPVDTSLPVKPNPPPPPLEPAKPEEMAQPKEQTPKPAPKAPDEDMALERRKEADAKKRAEAALKRMRDQLQKQRAAEEAKKLEKRRADLKAFEQKYRAAIAGNQKNQGTSLTGQMAATRDAYLSAISDKIHSYWALPSYVQDSSLKALVLIHLDGHGNVLNMRFTRTSGNKTFDDNAESAIRSASPLPAPPAELASYFRSTGLLVGFPE